MFRTPNLPRQAQRSWVNKREYHHGTCSRNPLRKEGVGLTQCCLVGAAPPWEFAEGLLGKTETIHDKQDRRENQKYKGP